MPSSNVVQVVAIFAAQFWRLKHGWKMVRDHEEECGHSYDFVFRWRTDANLVGTRSFASLFADVVRPNYAEYRESVFLMSDRVFATSHRGMSTDGLEVTVGLPVSLHPPILPANITNAFTR